MRGKPLWNSAENIDSDQKKRDLSQLLEKVHLTGSVDVSRDVSSYSQLSRSERMSFYTS